MPDPPRMYVGVAAVRERLFVVGGLGRAGEGQVVQSYDPKSDRWEAHEKLPREFSMPNVAGVGGKLYVLGGLGIAEVMEYDLDTRRWTAKTPMPGPGRGVAAVGVVGPKILLAGGITPGKSGNMLNTGMRLSELLAYDTAKDEWEVLPEMALPRGYAMGAVLGNQFWVAGGSSDFVRTDQVDVFDLAMRKWLDRPPLPFTLSSAGVGVIKGRIYLVGGIATSTGMIAPETLLLDPATAKWSIAAPMTTPRFATGAAALGDRIYVPGGSALVAPDVYAAVTTLEVFTP